MKAFSLIALLALILFFDSCDPFESVKKEELPPATQEGKNTFGCLVNGRVWLPRGNNGKTNLDASYDPSYQNGSLDVGAYRIYDSVDQFIAIGGKNINTVGEYLFSSQSDAGALLNDKKTNCSYNDPDNIISGNLNITRLDVNGRIISGTFEFSLAKSDCDTVKVTEGRFDMKF